MTYRTMSTRRSMDVVGRWFREITCSATPQAPNKAGARAVRTVAVTQPSKADQQVAVLHQTDARWVSAIWRVLAAHLCINGFACDAATNPGSVLRCSCWRVGPDLQSSLRRRRFIQCQRRMSPSAAETTA